MSSNILTLIEAALDNPNLQEELHATSTPERFVNIAKRNGYTVSSNELAQTLGQFHTIFGQVVESMLDSMPPDSEGDENSGSAKSEKVSGANLDLVKRLFSRGEAFDSEGFISFFTDSPVYQFGNFDVCLDKQSIQQSADNFFQQINAVYHEIKKIWEVGNLVFVEMDVIYWRKDNSMISLPCTDVFRVEGDKFSELRIFMDVNPVFDSSISVPPSASVMTGSGGQTMIPLGTMKQHYAQHPEGKQRIKDGFAPKWSIAGPQWAIADHDNSDSQTQASPEQLEAVGNLAQAVIAQDWQTVKSYLTDDIYYKVGSGAPVYGTEAVVNFFQQTFKTTAVFTGHMVRKIWQEPDIITLEMDAYYEMVATGKTVTISCCDIYRLRGNKVSEWRVYADMSPWNKSMNNPVILDQSKSSEIYPVIVVFEVEPLQQQELLDKIMSFGGSKVKERPGFISSTLHKSVDGKRVVNYTQWRSREEYENFANNSLSQGPGIFQAIPPDIHGYEIVEQTVQEN